MTSDQLVPIGTLVPNISLFLSLGGKFDLYDHLKTGPVLLLFIRGTWCKMCASYIQRLAAWNQEVVKKKVHPKVLIVTSETKESLNEVLGGRVQESLYACDPTLKTAKMFGLTLPGQDFSTPALVFIDKLKRLRFVHAGDAVLQNYEYDAVSFE